MKICGHYEEIDGYWCFVENVRGEKVIHDRVPMEQHLHEMKEARETLNDLITISSEDFMRRYGKKVGVRGGAR